jgi:RNA polymerase sigma factor (sigma-70 family)
MNIKSRNELWVKFLSGDNDSLSALYKAFAHDLYSYGLKLTTDKHLVKDCIHEVFIQIIVKRRSLILTLNIDIYLFKSLRNKIMEVLRSEYRKQSIVNQIAADAHNYGQHAEQIMIDLEEDNEARKKISTAIAKLPNRQSEIIYLKYTEGLNYDEIALLLQIDKASARTLLYRSLKSIKDQLCI